MGRPTKGYFIDGERVPGVTTILGRFKESGGLIHWAWDLGMKGIDYKDARDSAANSGTLAHDMVEHYLGGGDPETALKDADEGLAEKARSAFAMYKQWEDSTKFRITPLENPLVSKEYRFGGTPDALGELEGYLYVLDWKTSNAVYSDYLLQLAAYKHLLEEHGYGGIKGFHLCRFSKEDADFSHHFYTDLSDAWEMFKHLREAYELDKKLKKRVR